MHVLVEPLFYVFLVYGASFFLLALLVAKGTSGASSIPLIGAFNLLAMFGLAHGITEITDWVRFIRRTLGAPEMQSLLWLSQLTLVLSFILLLQFGINLLTAQSIGGAARLLRIVPGVALVAFAVTIVSGGITDVAKIGLYGRYTFGFASAALAAVALAATAKALEPLGDRRLVAGLLTAAVAFGAYAVFGGLFVHPILGVPIQMFRAACAVTIALSCFSLLSLSTTVAAAPQNA